MLSDEDKQRIVDSLKECSVSAPEFVLDAVLRRLDSLGYTVEPKIRRRATRAAVLQEINKIVTDYITEFSRVNPHQEIPIVKHFQGYFYVRWQGSMFDAKYNRAKMISMTETLKARETGEQGETDGLYPRLSEST